MYKCCGGGPRLSGYFGLCCEGANPLASAFAGSPGVPIFRTVRFLGVLVVLGFLVNYVPIAQIKMQQRVLFELPNFQISDFRLPSVASIREFPRQS
jgi:hypothetical protein